MLIEKKPCINTERKMGGVLEYLYAGGSIKINEEDCYLCTSDNGDIDIGAKRISVDTQTNEEKPIYLRLHLSLGDFIHYVEKMTDEEWAIIAFGNVLRKIK